MPGQDLTRFFIFGGKRRACLTRARPWRWKWQLNRRVFRVTAFGVTLEVPFTRHYVEGT